MSTRTAFLILDASPVKPDVAADRGGDY